MANLYLLTQDVNDDHDTYDSAVVCAKTADEAKLIHPGGVCSNVSDWAHPNDVKVRLIGKAIRGTELNSIILASYRAG